MKSRFSIGDKVKDSDGDIAIITDIWERKEAPNRIGIKYKYGFPIPTAIVLECDLEVAE